MSNRPSVTARRFLSREEWLARREARRQRQRALNIVRAAQMHEMRVGRDAPGEKPASLSAYYIGCSGWFYWHWRGRFYPAEGKTSAWFNHYAKTFNTVELNAPFYAWPTTGTVRTWKKQIGRRRFIYTVKVSELITHRRLFARTAELVKDFGLIAECSALAWDAFSFNCRPSSSSPRQARPHRHATGPRHRNSVEFRHKSWWNPAVFEAFRKAGIIFCSCSGPRLPDDLIVTAARYTSAFMARSDGIGMTTAPTNLRYG